jgi:hypothetical protein
MTWQNALILFSPEKFFRVYVGLEVPAALLEASRTAAATPHAAELV